jgi:hypothetical protein|tara:strand:- start:1005 stop:1220 length:216 start_codon:yes stop_codon:yes gene_type:complete
MTSTELGGEMKPGNLVKIHGDDSGEVFLLMQMQEVDHLGSMRSLCVLNSSGSEYKAWEYDLEKVVVSDCSD